MFLVLFLVLFMVRSLKKGPFIAVSLYDRINNLNLKDFSEFLLFKLCFFNCMFFSSSK